MTHNRICRRLVGGRTRDDAEITILPSRTLGKQGDFKGKVLKVNIPRNDVKVTVAGVATPAIAQHRQTR
jgi:hypothetical protein